MNYGSVPRWMASPWFWVPGNVFGFGVLILVDGRRVLVLSALDRGAWLMSVVAGLVVAALGLILVWSGYRRRRVPSAGTPPASATALRRLSAVAGVVLVIAMPIAFAVTHRRPADDRGADTPFQVITLTALIVLYAVALSSIVFIGVRRALGRSGDSHHPRGTGRQRR